MMRDLAEQFQRHHDYQYCTGKPVKGQLLQQFVSADALLVTTSSFWEGVDVRGDTLSFGDYRQIAVYTPRTTRC